MRLVLRLAVSLGILGVLLLVLPWTERYTEQHVRHIASQIETAMRRARPTTTPVGVAS